MTNNTKLIPFNYFGGKFRHLDWIIKQLPQTKSYVEVFGGSGVVLINRKPSPIETYNDLDLLVVNFFKMLREKPNKLLNNIYLTPYSKNEYFDCFRTLRKGTELERARKFFVVSCQSFNSSCSRLTGWKMSTIESRAILSESVNRWITKIPNLLPIIDRLRKVQISNYDFRQIFKKFDSPDTLFYCDPPYLHLSRSGNSDYNHELTDSDHSDLLELCLSTKAKVAISGYENSLYSTMLKDFYKSKANNKRTGMCHSSQQEILWTNYNPDFVNEDLFKRDDKIA